MRERIELGKEKGISGKKMGFREGREYLRKKEELWGGRKNLGKQ